MPIAACDIIPKSMLIKRGKGGVEMGECGEIVKTGIVD
jgi:hypothetical protein